MTWDRRQLVQAAGRLRQAHRQVQLAIERPGVESELRALCALKQADLAVTDLRRFTNRKARKPL